MARRPTYLGLQILRVVAAVLVLITHSGFYVSERLDPSFKYWGTGAAGVDLFFVISGFVMVSSSGSLIDNPRGWIIFTQRRLLRIAPMYWLATTLKLALMLLAGSFVFHARFGFLTTLLSYLFLPTRNVDGGFFPVLGVGWTLNFEMFFYLLFALALFLRVSAVRFVGPVLLMLSAGAIFKKNDWPAVSFYLNPIVLDFLFGMLVARGCLRRKFLPPSAAIVSVIAGVLLLLVFPVTIQHISFAGLAATAIIAGVVGLEAYFASIPRWLIFLADASYVIYLFHPMLAPIVPTALSQLHLVYPLVSIVLSVGLAVAAGCVIHKVVEMPITLWLKQFVAAPGALEPSTALISVHRGYLATATEKVIPDSPGASSV